MVNLIGCKLLCHCTRTDNDSVRQSELSVPVFLTARLNFSPIVVTRQGGRKAFWKSMFPATKYVSSKACYFFSCGFVLAWKCTSFSWILKIASIGIQSSLSLTLLTFLSVQDPWNRLQSFIAFLKSSAEFEVRREKLPLKKSCFLFDLFVLFEYSYSLFFLRDCSEVVTVQKLLHLHLQINFPPTILYATCVGGLPLLRHSLSVVV